MAGSLDVRQKIAYAVSVLFHPVFVPLYTVILYFYVSPRYFLPQNIKFLIFYLLIVAIIIPLLFFWIMFSTRFVSGLSLENPRERFYLSLVMAIIYFIILNKIMHYHQYIELYPFFLGIFLSVLMLSVYNFWGQKPSIHAMSVGGMFVFFVIWSYYTHRNILFYLSLIVLTGAIVIATRLYLKAHDGSEIIRGLLIGAAGQIISFYLALRFF